MRYTPGRFSAWARMCSRRGRGWGACGACWRSSDVGWRFCSFFGKLGTVVMCRQQCPVHPFTTLCGIPDTYAMSAMVPGKTIRDSSLEHDPARSHSCADRGYPRVPETEVHPSARACAPRLSGCHAHALRSCTRCLSPDDHRVAPPARSGRCRAGGLGRRGAGCLMQACCTTSDTTRSLTRWRSWRLNTCRCITRR